MQLFTVNLGYKIHHKSTRFAQKPEEMPMIPRDKRQAPQRDLLETYFEDILNSGTNWCRWANGLTGQPANTSAGCTR
jgi:hypothetical protein